MSQLNAQYVRGIRFEEDTMDDTISYQVLSEDFRPYDRYRRDVGMHIYLATQDSQIGWTFGYTERGEDIARADEVQVESPTYTPSGEEPYCSICGEPGPQHLWHDDASYIAYQADCGDWDYASDYDAFCPYCDELDDQHGLYCMLWCDDEDARAVLPNQIAREAARGTLYTVGWLDGARVIDSFYDIPEHYALPATIGTVLYPEELCCPICRTSTGIHDWDAHDDEYVLTDECPF